MTEKIFCCTVDSHRRMASRLGKRNLRISHKSFWLEKKANQCEQNDACWDWSSVWNFCYNLAINTWMASRSYGWDGVCWDSTTGRTTFHSEASHMDTICDLQPKRLETKNWNMKTYFCQSTLASTWFGHLFLAYHGPVSLRARRRFPLWAQFWLLCGDWRSPFVLSPKSKPWSFNSNSSYQMRAQIS